MDKKVKVKFTRVYEIEFVEEIDEEDYEELFTGAYYRYFERLYAQGGYEKLNECVREWLFGHPIKGVKMNVENHYQLSEPKTNKVIVEGDYEGYIGQEDYDKKLGR